MSSNIHTLSSLNRPLITAPIPEPTPVRSRFMTLADLPQSRQRTAEEIAIETIDRANQFYSNILASSDRMIEQMSEAQKKTSEEREALAKTIEEARKILEESTKRLNEASSPISNPAYAQAMQLMRDRELAKAICRRLDSLDATIKEVPFIIRLREALNLLIVGIADALKTRIRHIRDHQWTMRQKVAAAIPILSVVAFTAFHIINFKGKIG